MMTMRRMLTGMVGALALPGVAVAAIPSTAELQRLNDVLQQPIILESRPLPLEVAVPTPTVAVRGLNFVLQGVDVSGGENLPPELAAKVFTPLVGRSVNVQEVQAALVKLNKAYRDSGHVLAQATLPPQDLSKDGAVLKIEVTEGRIAAVRAEGDVARGYVAPVLSRLISVTEVEPTKTGPALERALLRLNDLPGTTALARLEPGKVSGTSELVVKLDDVPVTMKGGLSNSGSRYLGPNQVQADIAFNNPLLGKLGWTDELGIRLVQTPRLRELSYGEVRYSTPLNTYGTSVQVNGALAVSRPGWTLEGIDAESKVRSFGGELRQNLYRTRALSNDVYLGFDWQDTDTTALGLGLTNDHLRELEVGLRWWGEDGARGIYQYDLGVVHGLNGLGASGRQELGTSRYRGTGSGYTKVEAHAERLQTLNENWGLLLAAGGQFSSHALLSGAEFALGGQQFGRGYEPSELVGDHGVGGRSELQLTFRPEFKYLPRYQLFGFYEGGAVWNKDRGLLDNEVETLFSTGGGLRLPILDMLDFEMVVAKPTTRNVASTGQDNPQVYFRLGGTFNP